MRPTRCPLCKEVGKSINHILFNCEAGGTGYSSAWNAQMGYLLMSLNVTIRREIQSLKIKRWGEQIKDCLNLKNSI